MASVGWIDFSPSHRNRVGSVLDLLRPDGMVDELGLGTMRDALANQLFPGISTIQTRAKYFFIIPYILYEYQNLRLRRKVNKPPSKYLEDREYDIMWYLAEYYDYVEGHGVIGISKKKPNKIVRRPSAIYWNGIYNYQFIKTDGLSADAFLNQSLNQSLESLLSNTNQGDDGNADDLDAEHENLFKIKVPYKQNWEENLTLDLEREEAEFFHDRIISIAKNRLVAEVLKEKKIQKEFMKAENFMDFSKSVVPLDIPDNLKNDIILAHDFSELMYGVHLAYNCQVQFKVFKKDHFASDFAHWAKGLKNNMLDYQGFNPDNLTFPSRSSTQEFINTWWDEAQKGFPNESTRDALVKKQEAIVKGTKARLQWNKTDDVKENTWLGLSHFNYRFAQAKTILTDIIEGLKR